MVRTVSLVWICAVSGFLWGCKEKPKTTEIVEKPKVDVAAGLPVGQDLGDQLRVEAAARLPDALKAEVVIEALGKAEVVVHNSKQFVGRTVLATYCFGGSTSKATSVTVCEYSSADAAKAGLEHSTKQFAMIPHRTLSQNKATVLTLVRGVDNPETKVEADKAIEVFTKL